MCSTHWPVQKYVMGSIYYSVFFSKTIRWQNEIRRDSLGLCFSSEPAFPSRPNTREWEIYSNVISRILVPKSNELVASNVLIESIATSLLQFSEQR